MLIPRSRERIRAAALGVLTAVLIGGCGQREESAKPPAVAPLPSAVQAEVVEARFEVIPIRLELTGRVAATTQAVLSSQVRAAVEEVLVHEGMAVAKGQILVKLDSRDLRARLERAEAEWENARLHRARMEGLLVEQAVSRQEVEDAGRAFKVADAERRTATVQLSHTIIKAPFDGVITEKQVEAGEQAVPGQPLVSLEDSRRLRLETTVAEGDLNAISKDMTIPVTIDALGSATLQGTVVQILPTGDPNTHTFLIKLDLPRTAGLKTGMFGRIPLDKGTGQTIVVPRTAVFERGQLTGVYVVGADHIARLRWIKVGRQLENRQEVLSGLNVGEHILLEAGKGSDGLPIQPS